MSEMVLVTGGAGFIGSHLVDALLGAGLDVRVFDNLEPQVHGELRSQRRWPSYVNKEAEYVFGDVRDRDAIEKALAGVDVVFHQAAMVGVGQSMYQIERYVDVNTRGTALLLDVIANSRSVRARLRKVVVASSMSIYGEGTYECVEHGPRYPKLRSNVQLQARDWELHCDICGRILKPDVTGEEKTLFPTSIYAISKKDQEEMCIATGAAYQIPTVALRYFNTYGPRQALSNPYTGVAAIFSGRLLNGQPPVIFEDGLQTRDFVHVSDIVQANLLAMNNQAMDYGVFNVGTGTPITILDVADALIELLGGVREAEIVEQFRAGDIRHCVADITRIAAHGYRPNVSFSQGVEELVEWVKSQTAEDRFYQARRELSERGLTT